MVVRDLYLAILGWLDEVGVVLNVFAREEPRCLQVVTAMNALE